MSEMVCCHISKILLSTQWPWAFDQNWWICKIEVLSNLCKPMHFQRQNRIVCTPSFTLVMRLFLIDVAFWGSCHKRKYLPLRLSLRVQRGPGCMLPPPHSCPRLLKRMCAHWGDSVVYSQRPAFVIPGTEGPEEGPGSGAPQVRAASGPPHQERLGGSLQSRRAAVPGRPLAARLPARSWIL